ncbi:hypothetical protein BJY04DRAFT_172501 [Aspergillus karnatakaensis]|uniref:uncharacterized protein n=1 Tax=Aspergillus karnatakaensis TaxID=1810916 RepID=UPI003CCD3812
MINIMHITPISRYSDEIRAIARQNSLKALEVLFQQKRETGPDYSLPLRDILHAATDCHADKIATYCLENGAVTGGGIISSAVIHSSFAVYPLPV